MEAAATSTSRLLASVPVSRNAFRLRRRRGAGSTNASTSTRRERFSRRAPRCELVAELVNASEGAKAFIEEFLPQLPVVGNVTEAEMPISVPTDGAVYEPELAHCPSCDPEHRAEVLIELEKARCRAREACAAADSRELEAERRRRLLAADQLEPFERAPPP